MMDRETPRQREPAQSAVAESPLAMQRREAGVVSPTVTAVQAFIQQSPRQIAQRQLIHSLMRPAAPAAPVAVASTPVAQCEPDHAAWAEYLLTMPRLDNNPQHAQTLLAMRETLLEFGRERILAAIDAMRLLQDEEEEYDDDEDPPEDEHSGARRAMFSLNDALQALNDAVYQEDDVGRISNFISALGLPVTPVIVQAVKDYNYRSTWINFNPENFHCWVRLSAGQGSIRDAQYLIHEAIEIGELLNVTPAFDPFMTNQEHTESGQGDHLSDRWGDGGRLYEQSHLVALEYEYRFLAIQVNRVAGTTYDYRDIAAADQERTEPAQLLPAGDGTTVAASDQYAEHADQVVQLPQAARQMLGLGNGAVSLGALVRAVKATPISGVAQLRRDPASPATATPVAQRVVLTIEGKAFDTQDYTADEISKLAHQIVKTDHDTAKLLFEAILTGDHKADDDEWDFQYWSDDDEKETGTSKAGTQSDPMAGLLTTLFVPQPAIHATLLSRDEICNFNHAIEDKEVEGFRYDALDQLISGATAEASIKRRIAKLVWGVVQQHVFLDGNKRTGQAMLASMAGKNGLTLGGDTQTLLNNAADAKAGMTEETFIAEMAASVLIGGD